MRKEGIENDRQALIRWFSISAVCLKYSSGLGNLTILWYHLKVLTHKHEKKETMRNEMLTDLKKMSRFLNSFTLTEK